MLANGRHRLKDLGKAFLRRQKRQRRFRRQFDIHTQPIHQSSQFFDQCGRCSGNRFHVDIAVKILPITQEARDTDQFFHRVIGVTDNPARKEQAFDIVALIKIKREFADLFGRELRPFHIVAAAIDAIFAVVNALIGEENFQQRNATSVLAPAVANSRLGGIAHAPFAMRSAGPARTAAGVVFCGIG